MRHRTAVLVLALMLGSSVLWAEAGTPAGSAAGSPRAGTASPGLQASPGALPPGFGQAIKRENGLRRFEILAFGSFPIALFYTNFGFELGAYIQSNFDSRYAPWPFSGEYTSSISDSERFGRMGVAVGISLLVAGVDAILVASLEKRKAAAAARTQAGTQAGPSPGASPASQGQSQGTGP